MEEFLDEEDEVYYVPDLAGQLRGQCDARPSLPWHTGVAHFESISISLGGILMLNAARQPHSRHCVTARIPLFLRDASIRC